MALINVIDADLGGVVPIKTRTMGGEEVTSHDVQLIVAGASVDIGAVADAAVITDANGSLKAHVRGLVKIQSERLPASLGQKTKANSLAVTFASDSDGVQLIAGTQSIGGVKDNGVFWTPIQLAAGSADTTTPLNITAAPASGLSIIVDDLLITVIATMVITVAEVSGATLFTFHATAGVPFTLKMRNGLRASIDKQIKITGSIAGQVYTLCSWHEV